MNTRTLLLAGLVVLVLCLPFLAQSNSSGGIGPGRATVDGHAIVRPVIKEKPEPDWPKTIQPEIKFTIVLRAVFRTDGKVTNISFVKMTPKKLSGLSQNEIKDLRKRAIDAAKEIKFLPATKDGLPVSMWMELEYEFQLDDEIKPVNRPPESN
jgi:hypothetical protein